MIWRILAYLFSNKMLQAATTFIPCFFVCGVIFSQPILTNCLSICSLSTSFSVVCQHLLYCFYHLVILGSTTKHFGFYLSLIVTGFFSVDSLCNLDSIFIKKIWPSSYDFWYRKGQRCPMHKWSRFVYIYFHWIPPKKSCPNRFVFFSYNFLGAKRHKYI